ncbi:MAG: hypothetical protein WD045_00885 [Pirellulaceae bacterium]
MCKAIPVSMLLLVFSLSDLQADGRPISFDVGMLVPSRDITTDDFRKVFPGEKLLEAQITVSSLINAAGSREPSEVVIRLESPNPRFQVHDYSPQTTLHSAIQGKISREHKSESDASAQIHLTGRYDKLLGGDATAGMGKRESTIEKYETLPEMEIVSASGTIRRGRGVYFRFKPSGQTALEGSKPLTLAFRVPADWRADTVRIDCTALAAESKFSGSLGNGHQVVARQIFTVALFHEGDNEAHAAAYRYIRAEEQLGYQISAQAAAIEKATRRSPLDQMHSLVSLNFSKPEEKASSVERFWGLDEKQRAKLPDSLNKAHQAYAHGLSRLRELSARDAAPQPPVYDVSQSVNK